MRRESVLVLGGSGQLGTALRRWLAERGIDFRAPSSAELDLTLPSGVEAAVVSSAPSAVINAAAFTDVNRAELPECRTAVDRLNTEAPAALAKACARLDIPLIHVSTDYVFDGAKGAPYVERDEPAPLQVYGASKLAGERAVLDVYPRALVARTSTVFGPSARDRSNYVRAILAQALQRDRIEVVRQPVSSPTGADDLARGLVDLLEVSPSGLVHVANRGECSRLELAREVIRAAGLGERVAVDERGEPAGTLKRPSYSALNTSLLAELTGRPLPSWRDAVARYVRVLLA